MKHAKLELLFDEHKVIKVNRVDDPVFYVFDYQKRSLNMQFQHFHNYYEVYFLLDDTAMHIIEGEYFVLQRYDLVLLKPQLLHKSMYPEHEEPKARLIIGFRFPLEAGFERETQRLLSLFDEKVPIFRFDDAILQTLVSYFNEIYVLGSSNLPGSALMIHRTFQKILWTIEINRKTNRYKRQETVNSIIQTIYDITSYLHSHFDEELSLPMLADKFSISPFYLSRKFGEVTGTSYVTYVQLVRIRHAQHLLLYSTASIMEICEKCGFLSFSQFNRVFHKYCGMSPTEFRKDLHHNAHLILNQAYPERNADAALPRILQSPEEQEGKRPNLIKPLPSVLENKEEATSS